MNTALIAFLIASSTSINAPLPVTSKPGVTVKKPGMVTLQLSTEHKTTNLALTSVLDRSEAGELASYYSFMAFGGRVITQKLGGKEQVIDRSTQVLLKFHLDASTPPTFVARLEAQLDRCLSLARGVPDKKFEAKVQLDPDAFEQLRAAVASAPSGLMRLDVYAKAIQSVTCTG